MNRSLGGVALPKCCRWVNQHNWVAVRSSGERTTGGVMVFEVQQLRGGQQIALEFKRLDEPLKLDFINEIKQLSVIAGLRMVFVWDDMQYSVLFDYEKGAHEFTPIIDVLNQTNQTWFEGKINLITLG